MKTSKSAFNHLSVFGFVLLLAFLQSCQTSNNKLSPKSQNPNGRNDSWGFVGIGGGGALFSPTVSPFNPNFAFASCDMTGSFVTYNGGKSWRMFNLHNHVRFFVFDPLDSNTVYANSIALFKSIDKGNTWKIVFPNTSEILGFVAKGDHAEEVVVTKDSVDKEILALAIDPDKSTKLYAAIRNDEAVGFYISDDSGDHWTKDIDLDKSVQNIFIDPSSSLDNRTIYVTENKGIKQRINGAWKENNGPKDVDRLTTFAGGYDLQNKKFIIYAISGRSYFNSKGDKSGIYFTNNGGFTWENRQDGLLAFSIKNSDLPEWRTIATSLQNPNIVYVSYNELKVHADTTCIGVARSEDYGKSWKLVWKDKLTKGGQTSSPNFGKDWLNERFGPTWGENPFSIGVSPTNPKIFYTTDFGRVIKSFNGGKTWESVYSITKDSGWVSNGIEVTTGYGIMFDPFNGNHVFILNTDIGLIESNDGTVSWNSASKENGIPKGWINSCYWLTFDPQVKGKVWAAMSDVHDLPRPKMWRRKGIKGYNGGILVTENGGKTWQPISSDIGEAAMTHILIDPTSNQDSRTLYACAFGKGVYKSTDGGKTWLQKNNGIAGNEPFAWRIVRKDNDGSLYLIINRRSDDGSIGNDKDGALYKSVDGAENWARIALPEGTNAPTSLVFDSKTPNKLIMSAWGRKTQGRFTPDTGGGIFITNDEGKTWKQTMAADQHIHDITFDNRNNRFYACGFNGSAYFSEDAGNNWVRIKGYNFKWGKRVDLDPKDPEKVFIVTFGGGVWYGPAKGDNNAIEDITKPIRNI